MKLKILYRDVLIQLIGGIIALASIGLIYALAVWTLPVEFRQSGLFALATLVPGTWILLSSTRGIAVKFGARCPHCGGLVSSHSRDILVRKSATRTFQCATCGSLLY